jgi:hypothetical protein
MKTRETVMRDKAVTSRVLSAAIAIWAKAVAPFDDAIISLIERAIRGPSLSTNTVGAAIDTSGDARRKL